MFRLALPSTDRIHLTRVHATVPADTFLPELIQADWIETWREDHAADERHAYPYSFVTLERRAARQ
jgi:dihydrofolate reductase